MSECVSQTVWKNKDVYQSIRMNGEYNEILNTGSTYGVTSNCN